MGIKGRKGILFFTLALMMGLALTGCRAINEANDDSLEPSAQDQQRLLGQIAGEWNGNCVPDAREGMSYRDSFMISSARTFQWTTQIFINGSCSGEPRDREIHSGPFKISEVSGPRFGVLDMKFLNPEEGQYSFMRAEISVNGNRANVRLLSILYIKNGREVPVPSRDVAALPVMFFTKVR